MHFTDILTLATSLSGIHAISDTRAYNLSGNSCDLLTLVQLLADEELGTNSKGCYWIVLDHESTTQLPTSGQPTTQQVTTTEQVTTTQQAQAQSDLDRTGWTVKSNGFLSEGGVNYGAAKALDSQNGNEFMFSAKNSYSWFELDMKATKVCQHLKITVTQ